MATIHQTIARMRDEGYSEEEIQEKVERLEDQKEFDRRARIEDEMMRQGESFANGNLVNFSGHGAGIGDEKRSGPEAAS